MKQNLKQESGFRSNGKTLFIVGIDTEADIKNGETYLQKLHEYKLAFPFNVDSQYTGSKFLYLLKRFFTAWRTRP